MNKKGFHRDSLSGRIFSTATFYKGLEEKITPSSMLFSQVGVNDWAKLSYHVFTTGGLLEIRSVKTTFHTVCKTRRTFPL